MGTPCPSTTSFKPYLWIHESMLPISFPNCSNDSNQKFRVVAHKSSSTNSCRFYFPSPVSVLKVMLLLYSVHNISPSIMNVTMSNEHYFCRHCNALLAMRIFVLYFRCFASKSVRIVCVTSTLTEEEGIDQAIYIYILPKN